MARKSKKLVAQRQQTEAQQQQQEQQHQCQSVLKEQRQEDAQIALVASCANSLREYTSGKR
jgi:hypothetical protein